MRTIIEDYGRVILLVILVSGCLTMFVNFWWGRESLGSKYMQTMLRASTDSMVVTSTNDDGGFYIKSEDGTVRHESALGTSSTLKDISKRTDPKLYGVGEQNTATQLLINKSYHTEDLFWAVDADGVEIHKSLTSDNGINSDNYFNGEGYFRVLSISTASGYDIISNLSDLDSNGQKAHAIAYKDVSYSNKKGIAGSSSYASADTFYIYAGSDKSDPWLSYNVKTQKWYFYKSGTYCLNVFVCDSEGKSTTGTVYISVMKRLTENEGAVTNNSAH